MLEFIDGATAIVRGALAAGCTFFAGYPITPASQILIQMMSALPRVGGVAIQAEDEIASIGMCIGAALTGARSFTATSGPGLSLYSENIGLAIMGQVPLVIVDVQRQGPATGGATTVAQGDVQFVRWGTSGGYPIIALAPSSIPECYLATLEAFALAERFRCPVFVLADKELVTTMGTVRVDSFPQPGPLASRLHPQRARPADEPAADLPPLLTFGGETLVRFTGSSHDEQGWLSKDPRVVGALNRHLVAKLEHHDEIEWVSADLQAGARTLLISYGITAQAMRETVQQIRESEGGPISALTIHSLWPVPQAAIRAALAGVERVVVAELNSGDYRREVERIAAGRVEVLGLNRVDGELISPEQMRQHILQGAP
jgi:2-oxoglutarate ferredoxin oxidoreductase subunit alpha